MTGVSTLSGSLPPVRRVTGRPLSACGATHRVRDTVTEEIMRRRAFTTRAQGLSFAWEGGAYIDVIYKGNAFEVINVWDYETDAPTIPRTQRGFQHAVRDWLDTEWRENGAAYWENQLRYM